MKKTIKIASTLVLAVCLTFGTAACGSKTSSTTKTSRTNGKATASVTAVAAPATTKVLHIEKTFGSANLEKAVATAEAVQAEKAEAAVKAEEEKKAQEEAEKAAKKTAKTTSSTKSNTSNKKTTSSSKKSSGSSSSGSSSNGGGSSAPAAQAAPSRPSVSGLSVNGILALVNYERNCAGLGSLSLDGTLCQMAAVRCPEIATTWSHTRPDGTNITAVARDFGFRYSVIGENLARGQSSSERAVTQWMNSSGHRANIMGNYTRTGIAIQNVNGKNCIVQLFAN